MNEIFDVRDQTPRLKLSLLNAAQAQKEITHNEALMRIDILIASHFEGVANDPDSLTPDIGQCWIVGTAPIGAFVEAQNALACWTSSGWVFAMPVQGQRAHSLAVHADYFFNGMNWVAANAINGPIGGNVIDVETRLAFNMLIAELRNQGILAAL